MKELRDIININYTHVSMVPETQAIFTYKIALKETLDKINDLLEKEKEQIENSYCEGFKDGSEGAIMKFDEYIEKTYD